MKKISLVLLVLTVILATGDNVVYSKSVSNNELTEIAAYNFNGSSDYNTFYLGELSQWQVAHSVEAKAAKLVFSSRSLLSLKLSASKVNLEAIPLMSPKNKLRYTKQVTIVNGYLVYVYTPCNNLRTKDVLLYAHGGGFALQLLSSQVNAMLDIAYSTGQKVVIPVYPLSFQRNGNATTVLNLFNATFNKYSNSGHSVDLIGDSAGGSIVLSLVAYREAHRMSLPNNVIALFPALDGTYSNPAIPSIEPRDPFLSASGLRISVNEYAGHLNINDYRVSPINGVFSNKYNLMLTSADIDILKPDIFKFSARLNSQGITHNFRYYPNTYHDFILFPTRETRQLKNEVISFINNS